MNRLERHFRGWIFAFFMMYPLLGFADADDAFPRSSRAMAIDAMNTSLSDQNWLFSPLSASACLSMVYAGSDGRTAYELREALHLSLDQNLVGESFCSFLHNLVHNPSNQTDFKLTIIQGIWSQLGFPFLDQFISSIRHDFEAEIESIDFSSSEINRINRWISDQTEQKINNLFNPADIDASTKLVLANTIYFNGCWIDRFQPHCTIRSPFTISPGCTKAVETMQQLSYFQYFEDSDWQAVMLPFTRDGSLCAKPVCLLLLSKQSEAAHRLTEDQLYQILTSAKQRKVHVQVPRFKFEQRFDLQSLLQRLGVRDSFSMLADFSKMDGRGDLYLSKVVQKCFFSMDEQGVEAAAATGAVMNVKDCKPTDEDSVTFIANRPFEFMLFDQNSKTCLILGHVADPLQ